MSLKDNIEKSLFPRFAQIPFSPDSPDTPQLVHVPRSCTFRALHIYYTPRVTESRYRAHKKRWGILLFFLRKDK